MTAVDKLIAVAEDQIGYLEKKSNKDLDSKTANAGSNNYTKYNRDLKAWTGVGYINAQWCQAFVDWCFIKAFGVEDAKKLLYVFTNYTPTGSDAFKKRGRYIKRGNGNPKRGDVIYFYSTTKGRIGHVGIVYKVSGKTVYTIEGNTSGASSLITNGGGVRKKSYSMSSSYIDGYGSVDYSAIGDTVTEGLHRGDHGTAVEKMQRALLLWDAACLPEYGADGDFGSETEKALKAYQKEAGLPVTGIYDEATRKALTSIGKAQRVEATADVYVRSAPGKDNRELGVLKRGETALYQGEKIAVDGLDWFLIEFKGENGWVSSRYSKVV